MGSSLQPALLKRLLKWITNEEESICRKTNTDYMLPLNALFTILSFMTRRHLKVGPVSPIINYLTPTLLTKDMKSPTVPQTLHGADGVSFTRSGFSRQKTDI
ncbi:hypothetical protein JOB18_006301 [Solea senegalensis]|uniref:Uncharacterized protein n=1 Tax=Solea senegalensis TaxID=28829 RepID=A0AAV6Q297_SOLSE|nr:hypothetical protein JOB18_006301 [Solea senegalensis]